MKNKIILVARQNESWLANTCMSVVRWEVANHIHDMAYLNPIHMSCTCIVCISLLFTPPKSYCLPVGGVFHSPVPLCCTGNSAHPWCDIARLQRGYQLLHRADGLLQTTGRHGLERCCCPDNLYFECFFRRPHYSRQLQ